MSFYLSAYLYKVCETLVAFHTIGNVGQRGRVCLDIARVHLEEWGLSIQRNNHKRKKSKRQ